MLIVQAFLAKDLVARRRGRRAATDVGRGIWNSGRRDWGIGDFSILCANISQTFNTTRDERTYGIKVVGGVALFAFKLLNVTIVSCCGPATAIEAGQELTELSPRRHWEKSCIAVCEERV